MSVVLDEIPDKKPVFGIVSLFFGAFLGGPLVAGYFFAQNFKALNQRESFVITWIVTVVAVLAFVIIGLIFPINTNFPKQLIPLVYSAIAVVLFYKYQKEEVQDHVNAGAVYHRWGRVALVTFLGIVIMTVLVLTYFLVSYLWMLENQF